MKNQIDKFSHLGDCQKCMVLEEQLDIERNRNDKLLLFIIADTENSDEISGDDEEVEEMVEIRSDRSWNAQKNRMINRARIEHERRKKEN